MVAGQSESVPTVKVQTKHSCQEDNRGNRHMNKTRRKALDKLWALLDNALEELRSIKEEEEDAFENLPESIQNSERGEQMSDNVYNLEEAISNLEQCTGTLWEISEA